MKFIKSKTLWFAFLLSVASVAQGMLGFIADPLQQAIAGIVISAIVAILRLVTDKPVSAK